MNRHADDGAAVATEVLRQGQCVLLHDDNFAWREMCEDGLSEFGFELVSYGSPQESASMAATMTNVAPEAIFFLLLSVLDMPFLRNDEVSLRLRQIVPQFPVVICCGSQELAQAAQAVDAVAMAKPFQSAGGLPQYAGMHHFTREITGKHMRLRRYL